MTDPYFLLKKHCGGCGRTRPRSAFARRSAVKDGLQPHCRDCKAIAKASWTARNPTYDSTYRQVNADRERDRQRAWSIAHPDKKSANFKRWYAKHGDVYRDSTRQQRRDANRAWRQANPKANNERVARRRALKMSLFVEDVSRESVWCRDGGICYLCHAPADPTLWHLDHVIPITRGGEHSYANTAVSHPSCNMTKSNRTPDEHWARLTILKWRADRRMERTAQTFGG